MYIRAGFRPLLSQVYFAFSFKTLRSWGNSSRDSISQSFQEDVEKKRADAERLSIDILGKMKAGSPAEKLGGSLGRGSKKWAAKWSCW